MSEHDRSVGCYTPPLAHRRTNSQVRPPNSNLRRSPLCRRRRRRAGSLSRRRGRAAYLVSRPYYCDSDRRGEDRVCRARRASSPGC